MDKQRTPLIMGILNVTPDSFSDGGMFLNTLDAIDHGKRMLEEEADWIDVGGESTRPGAESTTTEEELRRVIPVIEALAEIGASISVDTSKAEVARRSLAAGAKLINDVSGLREPEMVELCAESGCRVCIMHMLGTPKTMQAHPVYGDVVRDVKEYLHHAATVAESSGVRRDRIWIDPGFGFGKTSSHNLQLLKRLEEIVGLGYPVLVGFSRKSFLGKVIGQDSSPAPIDQRLEPGIVAQTIAQQKGAQVFRVHDVAGAKRAADFLDAFGP